MMLKLLPSLRWRAKRPWWHHSDVTVNKPWLTIPVSSPKMPQRESVKTHDVLKCRLIYNVWFVKKPFAAPKKTLAARPSTTSLLRRKRLTMTSSPRRMHDARDSKQNSRVFSMSSSLSFKPRKNSSGRKKKCDASKPPMRRRNAKRMKTSSEAKQTPRCKPRREPLRSSR